MLTYLRAAFRRRFPQKYTVISYPKSGRTWLRIQVARALALYYGTPLKISTNLVNIARQLPGYIPYIYFSHDDKAYRKKTSDIEFNNENKNKRIIILLRDPRDIIVSLYYHKKFRNSEPVGDIDNFVMDANFGIYNVIRFFNCCYDNLSLLKDYKIITYERMKNNPEKELRSFLEFIGIKKIEPEILHAAIEYASFDNLKEKERDNYFDDPIIAPGDTGNPNSYKVRKGEVDGYKSELMLETIEKLDQLVEKELPWYKELR